MTCQKIYVVDYNLSFSAAKVNFYYFGNNSNGIHLKYQMDLFKKILGQKKRRKILWYLLICYIWDKIGATLDSVKGPIISGSPGIYCSYIQGLLA